MKKQGKHAPIEELDNMSEWMYFLWKCKKIVQENVRRIKYRKLLKDSCRFQNIHRGEEMCFVIGNGPSLNPSDLEKLKKKNIICYSSNRIFSIFPKTEWRPNYYAVSDAAVFLNSVDEINELDSCEVFMPVDIYERIKNPNIKINVFSRYPFVFIGKYPRFSNCFGKRFGDGFTITYYLLQLAVSMGFKKIYLLGVDFNYSFGIGSDGKIFNDTSVKDYFSGHKGGMEVTPNLWLNYNAYQKALKYSEKHGIKICNATRGGKLEVFERVDFDQLIENA